MLGLDQRRESGPLPCGWGEGFWTGDDGQLAVVYACFLKEFVGGCRWAHLDIAGTAYGEGKLSYQRKGAAGFPTRLLVDWVRSRAR